MLIAKKFKSGLTVRELKRMLADLPTIDEDTGEDAEVWMMTGEGLSSQVMSMGPLGQVDIMFGCKKWPY